MKQSMKKKTILSLKQWGGSDKPNYHEKPKWSNMQEKEAEEAKFILKSKRRHHNHNQAKETKFTMKKQNEEKWNKFIIKKPQNYMLQGGCKPNLSRII